MPRHGTFLVPHLLSAFSAPLRFKSFLSPFQNRPTTPACKPLKLFASVHRNRPPHSTQQPPVTHAVAIRKALPQIELQFGCNPASFPLFRFSKHRLAQDLPRPLPADFLEPRRTNVKLTINSSFSKCRFQSSPSFPRQRLQRSAQQHDRVLLPPVPCRSLDRFLKKNRDRQSWIAPRRSRRLSLGLVAALVPARRCLCLIPPATLFKNLHTAQIRLVSLQNSSDPTRCQSHCFPQPQTIIPQRYFAPASQYPEKSPLQRRQRHQRPIQIKKRPNAASFLL